jgi:hypothetical protein
MSPYRRTAHRAFAATGDARFARLDGVDTIVPCGHCTATVDDSQILGRELAVGSHVLLGNCRRTRTLGGLQLRVARVVRAGDRGQRHRGEDEEHLHGAVTG